MATTKRRCSVLIPYKKQEGKILVFMQKRSESAKRAPGMFGFWGGGAEKETETPVDVLMREIREELGFAPENFWRLGFYSFANKTLDVYCQEVGDDFESRIKISCEDEYGKWFSEDEILTEPKLIKDDEVVLRGFFSKNGPVAQFGSPSQILQSKT